MYTQYVQKETYGDLVNRWEVVWYDLIGSYLFS